MATVRKRKWRKGNGTVSESYQLTYYDHSGQRHREHFADETKAEAEKKRIELEILGGNHVPGATAKTVKDGMEAWLSYMERLVVLNKRERVTVRHYRTHVERHIESRALAEVKLNRLTSADIQEFVETLERELSHQLARKVLGTARMALGYCRRKQWLNTDPCQGIKLGRPRRYEGNPDELKIPPKEDIKKLLSTAQQEIDGRSIAMLRLMVFRGLRISEIRGLPRKSLDLAGKTPQITISQRADDYCKLGPPKSRNSYRSLALSPEDVLGLKRWLLAKGIKDSQADALVFGNGQGNPHSYQNLFYRWWIPLLTASGLVRPVTDPKTKKQQLDPKTGKPKVAPFFTPHQLRHAFASLHIERGIQPKKLQILMGHSSIGITMDTYGHLWKDQEADQALALAVEQQLG